MKIDSILNGIVLDHISAGKAMIVYKYLGLDKLDCSVAIIQNAVSRKMGRKDILKIDHSDYDINLDILGYIDPDITVSIIKDGKTIEKKKVGLPDRIVDVVRCKNPRCITTVEQGIRQIFKLTDPEKRTYRCIYCEAENQGDRV
ncbi:MAG: aspartate carbamoyltransferase regulatory subunit [Clostridium sp.]|nr:aspartate carbamoyltransferase regulatory subunit [Clostridium sp.]